VRRDPGRLIVQKLADEGAGSPFMARILMGILKLRDAALDGAAIEELDRSHEFSVAAISNARTSADKIVELWVDHSRKVLNGEVVRAEGQDIYISENIDKELRREVESFLNAGTRALKTGMQNLGKQMGIDIGFLFKQSGAFERGITALGDRDPDLAEYLRRTRTWSEPLVKSRIDLEHGSWTLPRIEYTLTCSPTCPRL
jgi:hypothetical protein